MKKRKRQEVNCDYCGKTFEKDTSEVKRNKKLRRRNYCSRVCVGKDNHKHFDKTRTSKHLNCSNRKDKYTLFRDHLRRAKRRKHFCNLTLEDMKEVWDSQKGICVYSNVKLVKSKNTIKNDPIYTMSLDRIDSSIGYTKQNIQFISVCMNLLKQSMTHENMLKMLEILKNKTL